LSVGEGARDLTGANAGVVDVPDRVAPGEPVVHARSPWQIAWRRLKRDRVALLSALFIVLLVIMAICAPLFETVTGHQVDQNNVRQGLDDNNVPVGAFTNGYWLGADQLGRDLIVRVAYGARSSLVIGISSTMLALLVAMLAGVAAGFFGRWVDNGISRTIDVFAAFPILLFAICMSVVLGASYATVIFTIVFFSWFYPARIFRGEVLAIREREFIDAARMVGASNWRIMRRHIMPHLLGPVIVYGTLSIAAAISFEAALSFLGFGLPANVPSWGRMIADAASNGRYILAPWMMIVPGTLLFLTVLSFNLLGDGLRDALDPRGGGDR
jgi:peptide/nickel transport system permease protein